MQYSDIAGRSAAFAAPNSEDHPQIRARILPACPFLFPHNRVEPYPLWSRKTRLSWPVLPGPGDPERVEVAAPLPPEPIRPAPPRRPTLPSKSRDGRQEFSWMP